MSKCRIFTIIPFLQIINLAENLEYDSPQSFPPRALSRELFRVNKNKITDADSRGGDSARNEAQKKNDPIRACLKTPPTLLFCRRERVEVKKTKVFRDALNSMLNNHNTQSVRFFTILRGSDFISLTNL